MPLYYSGDANDDGCLAIGKDCWAAPKDLKGYWQWPFDLEVLVLAGCSALNVTFSYGIANGPGRRGQRSLSAGAARSPQSWGTGIKLLLTLLQISLTKDGSLGTKRSSSAEYHPEE